MRKQMLAFAVCLLAVSPAFASWSLDNEASLLSFVSIKAGDVAEVHTFRELAGSVGRDGAFSLTIQLASVDTLIPIRDERMREMLFNIAEFPTASLTGKLDMREIESLAPGSTTTLTVDFVLDLHGRQAPMQADLLVVRLSPSRLLISARKPVVVNASGFDLGEGIERLREVVGLPSISQAVPVSCVLSFVSEP